MPPNNQDWNNFYAKLKGKTGLDLHLYKANQLQRRILSMMESKGAKTLDDFWTVLISDRNGMTWFQDKLAINVSELFRNPEKYEVLESQVLAELYASSKSLKIWSAGCSYGAEAHSIAAILHTNFPGRHTIIGSDIDQEALAQAKAGTFSTTDYKCVPKKYQRFFKKTDSGYTATDDIRKMLTFKSGNLLADRFTTGFDLICCRNVVIYFTEEAKDELYRKFVEALRPGGYLFVGGTERIFNASEIGFTQKSPLFYQKSTKANLWRNAS